MANKSNQVVETDADKIIRLENENQALREVNTALTAELEDVSAKLKEEGTEDTKSVSSETFTHEGDEYSFAFPAVLHQGEKVTSADVLADKELQKHFVKIGSGFIVKKKKK